MEREREGEEERRERSEGTLGWQRRGEQAPLLTVNALGLDRGPETNAATERCWRGRRLRIAHKSRRQRWAPSLSALAALLTLCVLMRC